MAGTYDEQVRLNDFAYDEFMYADKEFAGLMDARSGGALVMKPRPSDQRTGDFFTGVAYGSEVRKARLAPPNEQQPTTARQLKQLKQIDIRVGIVFDQYVWQSIAADWIDQPAEAQARLFGQTVAESFNREYQEVAMRTLIATFGLGLLSSGKDTVVESLIHDVNGPTTTPDPSKRLDMDVLTQARLRFGDDYENAAVVVMHTSALGGMNARNLSEYKELFQYGNTFQRVTSEGLPIYISDMPILTYKAGTATLYRTLILKRDALTLYDNMRLRMNFETSNGNTWIQDTAQAQNFINVKPMAFTWADTSNVHPGYGTTAATGKLAGLSTNDGAIDNPESWKRVGVDESRPLTKKDLPGVMIISQ